MGNPDIRLTYEHYRLMPEGERYELSEGDLLRTPPPSTLHQLVASRLDSALRQVVEERSLGLVLYAPLDVLLSPENVVQRDFLFIAQDRLGIIKPDYIQGAPDLVVEILSPSTSSRDLVAKRYLYAKYGVKEYWIVHPEGKSVEVLTSGPQGFETYRVFRDAAPLESPLLGAIPTTPDRLCAPLPGWEGG